MILKKRKSAISTVLIDNERVRVTEYFFAPGSETGWHKHLWDYIVVPQTDGNLLLESIEGQETRTTLFRGDPYYRKAGVEHNVINSGKLELTFIEIEIKAYPL